MGAAAQVVCAAERRAAGAGPAAAAVRKSLDGSGGLDAQAQGLLEAAQWACGVLQVAIQRLTGGACVRAAPGGAMGMWGTAGRDSTADRSTLATSSWNAITYSTWHRPRTKDCTPDPWPAMPANQHGMLLSIQPIICRSSIKEPAGCQLQTTMMCTCVPSLPCQLSPPAQQDLVLHPIQAFCPHDLPVDHGCSSTKGISDDTCSLPFQVHPPGPATWQCSRNLIALCPHHQQRHTSMSCTSEDASSLPLQVRLPAPATWTCSRHPNPLPP
eukprot:scaffold46649_cov22-Tisochrysis_lutea.AAC.2